MALSQQGHAVFRACPCPSFPPPASPHPTRSPPRGKGAKVQRRRRKPRGVGCLATPSVLQQASALLILVEVQIAVRVQPDSVPPIPRARARRAQPARQHLPIES